MELKDAAQRLEVELNEAQLEQFRRYAELLVEWNSKMNLTAIIAPEEITLKHFADCLSVGPLIENSAMRVLDIGSGAGFPGVPLKIARPALDMTLLDSLNKRVIFLRHLSAELGLSGIEAVHGRAEDLGQRPEYREQYDIVVSRAVANLSSLAEYCLPFAKTGGKFISMKGPDAKAEVSEANRAIFELGGEISDIKTIKIPFTDIQHSLIIISKKRHTPKKYPRKAVKIAKTPIV